MRRLIDATMRAVAHASVGAPPRAGGAPMPVRRAAARPATDRHARSSHAAVSRSAPCLEQVVADAGSGIAFPAIGAARARAAAPPREVFLSPAAPLAIQPAPLDPHGRAAAPIESPPLPAPPAPTPPPSSRALLHALYGAPEGGGRGASARASRDALALFSAVYGPPAAARPTLPAPPLPVAPSSPTNPSRLAFPARLLRGVVLARPNRFTMRVRLEGSGEVVDCHCPVTGALGGLGLAAFAGARAPCLVSAARARASRHATRARKTGHTVEAVSLAHPDAGPPAWVGVNQLAANRYVEHFLRSGALPALAAPGASVEREVAVHGSRLDFVVAGADVVEVKCPLDALPLDGGPAGGNPALVAAARRRRSAGDLLSRLPRARRASLYGRAAKHVASLADHLAASESKGAGAHNPLLPPARAALVQCFQFDAPPVRAVLPPPAHAAPGDGRTVVVAAMAAAAAAGVETWQVNLAIDEAGITLLDCFALDLFPGAGAPRRRRGGRDAGGDESGDDAVAAAA